MLQLDETGPAKTTPGQEETAAPSGCRVALMDRVSNQVTEQYPRRKRQ
jgi:hypothetical protein